MQIEDVGKTVVAMILALYCSADCFRHSVIVQLPSCLCHLEQVDNNPLIASVEVRLTVTATYAP